MRVYNEYSEITTFQSLVDRMLFSKHQIMQYPSCSMMLGNFPGTAVLRDPRATYNFQEVEIGINCVRESTGLSCQPGLYYSLGSSFPSVKATFLFYLFCNLDIMIDSLRHLMFWFQIQQESIILSFSYSSFYFSSSSSSSFFISSSSSISSSSINKQTSSINKQTVILIKGWSKPWHFRYIKFSRRKLKVTWFTGFLRWKGVKYGSSFSSALCNSNSS